MKLRFLVALVVVLPLLGCAQGADAATLRGPTWQLDSLRGQAVAASPEVTAVFTDDAQVAGSAGCNRYFGSAAVDGDKLTVGALGSTMMACEPASVMEQEATYLKTLETAARWEATADRLTVRDASGSVLLTYVRQPGA